MFACCNHTGKKYLKEGEINFEELQVIMTDAKDTRDINELSKKHGKFGICKCMCHEHGVVLLH